MSAKKSKSKTKKKKVVEFMCACQQRECICDIIDKHIDRILFIGKEVTAELIKAITKHDGMNSAHEAYAVILEEVDEFWDEVKAQTLDREKAKKELLQISAMAQRAILDLGL